jgi:5-formyltetrahydrofolate cyclo-ligase
VTGDFTDNTKAVLRDRVRLARAARSAADRQAAGVLIADRVQSLPAIVSARRVALYASMRTEPDTAPLMRRLNADGHELLLPRVRGEQLEWIVVTPDVTFTTGAFGISEPMDGPVALLSTADVVVVPALAVDGTGMRLGQGGGFYDRAISDISVPLIALIFDEELLDNVPAEPHDRRVDVIITPSRTIDVV